MEGFACDAIKQLSPRNNKKQVAQTIETGLCAEQGTHRLWMGPFTMTPSNLPVVLRFCKPKISLGLMWHVI